MNSVAENLMPFVPSILLVDHDASIRETFGLGLERCVFEMVVASGATEALRLIDSRKSHVLASDLHLPEAGAGRTIVSAIPTQTPRA